MATYIVKSPTGEEYEVDAPDGATEQEIMSYAQANMPAQEAPQAKPRSTYRDFAAGINRGYASLAGLPVDAVTGAINAVLPDKYDIKNPLMGSETFRKLFSKVGVETEGPRNFAGMAGEYLGTAPVTGAYGAVKTGAGIIGGIAKEAVSGGLAATGGYLGSKMAPDSMAAEMAGAMAPAALRAGLAAAAKPSIRAGVRPQEIQSNIALANRANAPVTASAAVPSKPVQALAGASSSIPGGVSIFKKAGEDAAAALRQRVATIVGGEADDVAKAGRTISRGLFDDTGFVARFKGKANSLYSKMDAKVPPNTRVPASNTYQFLSTGNKGVAGAPEMSARLFVDDALKGDADAFFADVYTNGGAIPYDALKRFRTSVGDKLADPDLIGSAQRAELKKLYGALTDDMADIAQRNGASKEFQRANGYYSAGTKRIEDFFESLDRKVSGEDIYKAVLGDSPQSATRILTLKKSLTPAEWQYVRKTAVTRMGRPVPSAASESAPAFSAGTFLTNYEKAKRNGVARAIFGTGQFRKDLDDVAKYASNLKAASDILANPSGTGARGLTASVLYYAMGLPAGTAVGAALGGGATALTGGAVAAAGITSAFAGNRKLALMLNSPEFVNWLATATKIPANRLPGHIARLGTIAGNDPELADALAEYANSLGQY